VSAEAARNGSAGLSESEVSQDDEDDDDDSDDVEDVVHECSLPMPHSSRQQAAPPIGPKSNVSRADGVAWRRGSASRGVNALMRAWISAEAACSRWAWRARVTAGSIAPRSSCSLTGLVRRSVAPALHGLDVHADVAVARRPPCASTIERAMAKAIRRPGDLGRVERVEEVVPVGLVDADP
jgi:hypothetical protein